MARLPGGSLIGLPEGLPEGLPDGLREGSPVDRLLPETDAALAEVLAELMAREPLFHRAELGTTHAAFDRMMAEDFWEVGASGAQYSRPCVLDLLGKRHKTPQTETLEPLDFRCRRLGPDSYLLTYTLEQGERKTRRCSLWERGPMGWKIVYHQGTIVSGNAAT